MLRHGIRTVDTLQIQCIIRYNEDNVLLDKTYTFSLSNKTEPSQESYWRSLENGEYSALTGESVEYMSNDAIYDANGIKIETVALVKDSDNQDILYLDISNNSPQGCSINIDNVTVNGLLIPSIDNNWIPNNMHHIFEINLKTDFSNVSDDQKVRKAFNIQEIAEITFTLDSDDVVVSIQIPGRQNTLDTSGIVIYDTANIKFVYKEIFSKRMHVGGLDSDDYQDYYSLLFYVENTSNCKIIIEIDEEKFFLNNKKTPLRGLNFLYIPAGYCGYLMIDTDYEVSEINKEYNVNDIKKIELNLNVEGFGWGEDSRRIDFTLN